MTRRYTHADWFALGVGAGVAVVAGWATWWLNENVSLVPSGRTWPWQARR